MRRVVVIWKRTGSASGSALIAVIFALLVVAAITGSLITATRTDLTLSRTLEHEVEDELSAESGIALAILNLSDPKNEAPLTADGRTYELSVDGRRLLIEVQSEVGKINLNQSPNPLLKRFLGACGSEGDAELLGKAIESHNAAKDGGAKAFLTVDELKRLEGASAEFIAAIEPYVSVYNFRAEPDFGLAPDKLKELMADGPARKPSGAAAAPLSALSSRSGIFTITASILEEVRGSSIRAIVYITGDKREPYYIFDWRRLARSESAHCGEAPAQ
jgi:general secretion pathway protein K